MKTNRTRVVKTSVTGLIAAAFLCVGLYEANAASTVATWDFTTTWTSATTVNLAGTAGAYITGTPNLNGTITGTGSTAITRVATGGQSGAYMQFNPQTSGNGQPMQFTLQLTAGAPMSGFTISYYGRVSATTAADTQSWAYSTDGGANWTTLTTQPGTLTTTWTQYTVTPNVSVASGTVWFRNTLSGATANNQNTEFDTISITAVPEPVNVALGVFGLSAVVVGVGRRYLRKRA